MSKKRERLHCYLSDALLPNYWQQPRLYQTKARRHTLNFDLYGWRVLNYLNHHLPTQGAHERKVGQKVQLGLKPRHSYVGC